MALESALRVIFNLNKQDELPSMETAKSIMYKRWNDHEETANTFRSALKENGLRLIAENDSIAANTLSAVYAPKDTLPNILKNSNANGFIIAGGLLKEIDPYFRVGHMGQSIYLGHILKFIQLLPKIIK